MIKKTLFVFDSLNLFKIINEIEENFHFKTKYIEKKNFKKTNLENYDNYLIITTNFDKTINRCVIIDNLPIRIIQLIEIINLNFLKLQFKIIKIKLKLRVCVFIFFLTWQNNKLNSF